MHAPDSWHLQDAIALLSLIELGRRELAEGKVSDALAFLHEMDDEQPVEPCSAGLRLEASQFEGPIR